MNRFNNNNISKAAAHFVTFLSVVVVFFGGFFSSQAAAQVSLNESRVAALAATEAEHLSVKDAASLSEASANTSKAPLEADPIAPFLQPHAQSVCDPCSAASFCLNYGTSACNAYSNAAKRGKGMESLAGGAVFGAGGVVLGIGLGAVLGYLVGALLVNQTSNVASIDFFSVGAIANGTFFALLFSVPFGVLFGASGTVWGLERGPDLFDMAGGSDDDNGGGGRKPSSDPADDDIPSKKKLPPPPGKQKIQALTMPF